MTPPSVHDACVLDAFDVDGMVSAARRLVSIPTWGGRETPAQQLVAEMMADIGLAVDRWEIDLDDVGSHPDAAWEIERTSALGVVGSLEGDGSGPTLILNGHVDVVPPGNESLWSEPPLSGRVRDGRLFGRGSLDMKGPLTAGLFALKAIIDADVPLAGTVRLQSVVGEEDGGIGTLATILRGYRGDGAVVMEPTCLAVVPLQAGCLNFRVEVPGQAAHGAVRDEGQSAIEKLFDVYGAIQALERARNLPERRDPLLARYAIPFPISIGTIRGGDWASSVPDHVTVEGRMGVRPDESPARARAELEACVSDAADGDPFLRDHRPRVTWWGGRFLPASTPPDHPVVQAVRSGAWAASGTEPLLEGVPFGADAGLLEHVGGTPAVLFGAGDIRDAHRPDESVAIRDLETMGRSLALAALRFCGAR